MAESAIIKNKKILVVDDEEGLRLLYKEELEDDGAVVTLAASGTEAIEKLEEDGTFDLILLDIKMPGMDGVEVLRRVKEKWCEIPVILCTAYPHYKHDFGTWASEAYVVKSSDLGELKKTIEDVLSRQ